MKKILIAVLLISSVSFAQHPALDLYSTRLAEGRPFFTYQGIYDSYDLFNSPLGVFEIDSSSLSIEVGYNLLSLGKEKGHFFTLPLLRMGEPGRAYFQVFYGPDFLSYDESITLPLHRFGLTLAAQSESGLFQASISSSGYIGTQSWKEGNDTRAILGLDNLRFDFGSRVHPMARVGVFIGAALYVDTLKSPERYGSTYEQLRIDRSAQVVLPAFGGFVDFGGGHFPVYNHLSLQYASSRFVYVAKNETNRGGVDGLGNEYSVINDSLQLFWLAAGRIPLGEHFIKPGLLVGFSATSGQLHWPDEDSDPFKMKDAIDGGFFDLTEVYFGIGTGFEVFNYADLFIEYVYNSASLDYGDYAGFNNSSNFPTSRGFHNFALGASTPLHEYLSLPLSLTPRIAYFMSQSAGAVEARRMEIDPLNPIMNGKSKEARYRPQTYLHGREFISGITIGLDAQSPDTKFGGSLYTTFLNKRQGRQSGIEMGVVLAFAVPGPASGLFD